MESGIVVSEANGSSYRSDHRNSTKSSELKLVPRANNVINVDAINSVTCLRKFVREQARIHVSMDQRATLTQRFRIPSFPIEHRSCRNVHGYRFLGQGCILPARV